MDRCLLVVGDDIAPFSRSFFVGALDVCSLHPCLLIFAVVCAVYWCFCVDVPGTLCFVFVAQTL